MSYTNSVHALNDEEAVWLLLHTKEVRNGKERQRWPVTTSPFKGHQLSSSVRENQIAEIGREIIPQIAPIPTKKWCSFTTNKVKNPQHNGANDEKRVVMHKRGQRLEALGQYGSHVSHECHQCSPMMDNGLFVKTAKKKPPPEAGALGLIKPQSLGVRNAAILQSRLFDRTSSVLLVILLSAIGQSHLWFLRNPGPRSLAW